jgi:hypothetical protein
MLDDPQDEPFTAVYMEKFKRVMTKKLIPAVGKHGKIFLTGTIKGWDDTNDGYIWLSKKPGWEVYRYPAANAMPPMTDVEYTKHKRVIIDQATGQAMLDEYNEIMYETWYEVTVKEREKYRTLYPERYRIEDLVAKRLEMMDESKNDDDFWSEYFLMAVNPTGKFFNKNRIKSLPPPTFMTFQAFLEWIFQFKYPVFLWIDPGGETGHGVAIVVGTKILGRTYWLDFVIVRSLIPVVAEVVGRLIVKWHVTAWGCEGNFLQKTCFAMQVEIFLKKYMEDQGWSDYYSYPTIKSSTGEKMDRIRNQLSIMIGLEGTDFIFFVNTEAQDYDSFNMQILSFGSRLASTSVHEFDLLDAMACMAINIFGRATKPVAAKR